MSEANEAWTTRWREGRTGFHQEDVNAHLIEHWPSTVDASAKRVLVPLCGMSLDLLWLHKQGHHVVGFELSSLAIEQFFAAMGAQPETTHQGPFKVHRWEGVELWEGDFFEITPDALPLLDAWYDRAAIVALSPDLRRRYIETIWGLLHPRAPGLALTFAYPQAEMSGPPYSVSENDLRTACQDLFEVNPLACVDMTEGNRWSLSEVLKPVFAVRGLIKS